MTLRGFEMRWTYSNAATTSADQPDPLLSLGGRSPNELNVDASAPYRQETLDLASTEPTVINDTETDTASTADPAVGDWILMVDGPAANEWAKVTAVNYGTGDITLDRPLSALPQIGDVFRSCRTENLFPDVTLPEALAGVVDHRMIYFLKDSAGSETNHKFYVVPIKSNGCTIEIYAGGLAAGNATEDVIVLPTDNPFQEFGITEGFNTNFNWEFADKLAVRYSQGRATPSIGSGAFLDADSSAIWIRRTVPPGVTAGECVFAIFEYIDDAVSQDAGADPLPFLSGFIFSWDIPEQTYLSTITQDRTIFTNGAARITATVTDAGGTPIPNLNCWLDILSGPGSINTNLDGRTDSNGQIKGVYTAPAGISVDPVIQLVIPTNPDF